MFPKLNKEETIEKLKELYERGYRWAVRDEGISYLLCFTLKPKKYMFDNFWGYVNENAPGVRPAYSMDTDEFPEIKWRNRSATKISDLIDVEVGADE